MTAALQDISYTYNITTSDPDAGDTRTISVLTGPAWLNTFTDNGNGTATLTGTPTNANLGLNNVTLQVTDLAGVTIDQAFVINVDNTNDAPVFTSTPTGGTYIDLPGCTHGAG